MIEPEGFLMGITQIRTPFRSPQANSIAERWVRSLRQECLDHLFIFNERRLRKVLAEYVDYFNMVTALPVPLIGRTVKKVADGPSR